MLDQARAPVMTFVLFARSHVSYDCHVFYQQMVLGYERVCCGAQQKVMEGNKVQVHPVGMLRNRIISPGPQISYFRWP